MCEEHVQAEPGDVQTDPIVGGGDSKPAETSGGGGSKGGGERGRGGGVGGEEHFVLQSEKSIQI